MKPILMALAFLSTVGFFNQAFAVTWTVEIENIRTWDTGKAEIFVKNPHDPNPAGSVWNCDYNIVLIGNPANPSLLSLAYSVWLEGKSVRINVTGSGSTCTTNYLQTVTGG